MEGYSQNFKIHTGGNKLKFCWYSGLQNSPIHITLVFLSGCELGKGMKYTPFCSLSGYRLLHEPQAHRLTMLVFLHKQHKSNKAIKQVSPYKYLGVWIDHLLPCKDHVDFGSMDRSPVTL